MALVPLRNPLTRFEDLPTAVSWRKADDNTNYWVDTVQYYVGDVVTSVLDGAQYVLNGIGGTPAESSTVLRGGDDPADAVSAGISAWAALYPTGAGYKNYQLGVPAPSGAAAAGVIPWTAGTNVVALPGDSLWISTLQYSITPSAASVSGANDGVTWSVTPNGAGAVVSVVSSGMPVAGSAAAQNLSTVHTITVPAAGSQVTLTGLTFGSAGTLAATVANMSWTLTRVY